ncbi:PAS domain S-box protein [Pelosinus sp. sgz500959]|uniref:PAS domain S-box protein n=1 Tax=Pelosinus sp. sgz500959 TaxID=3242472 RepID=UPI00366E8E1C
MNGANHINSQDTKINNETQFINLCYSHLFDNKHIIMLLIDPETMKIIDASSAACLFYGFSHEEMLNLSIKDINILTSEEIITEIQLAKSEQRNHFFFQHRLANGNIRFVEVHSSPIKLKDKELIYSIINDITEQKKIEEEMSKCNVELDKIVKERTAALEETNALLEEEISEHLNTEEMLRKTLEEVEDIYNHAPCGYHSLDKDGFFVRINDTLLKWLGYSRDELIGHKTVMEIMSPDSVKIFLNNFTEFKKVGYIKDLEFDLIRSDGTVFTVILSATAVVDSNGNYMMSRSSCYDITEHKKAKDELRHLNSKLESMVIERTGQLQDMNAELEESNAMLEEEISERENVERALKCSEELYRNIYENSPLAFGIWDTEFRFVDWNKRAEESFGWSKDEVIGKRFVDFLVPPEIKDTISDVAMNIMVTGVERITFNENITKRGEILLYEWHNSLLHDGVGNLIGVISVGLDKTETFKAEKTIRETQKQVEVANKELSKINNSLKDEIARRIKIEDTLIKARFQAEQANMAKSQFLANMSHEIRTPMNGIIGMTDLTLMTELQEEQRDYLTIVKSSTSLLLRVLNDILDYSKIESGKMDLESEPFNIRATSNEVVDLFTVAAQQKKLYIKLNIDDNIPQKLIGDSIRLRQILSNLVGNSVKFTYHGGVMINISLIMRLEGKIVLKFVVSDTGIGIPKDKVNKLFKRFSQVDDSNSRKFGGTGLGLAISKKLIEMMDGQIGMESKEEVGSKFFFTASFGIEDDSAEKVSNDNQSLNDVDINKENKPKILLAEDDEVSRTLANLFLTKKNAQVSLAKDGQEAAAILENKRFDLILMDINMPYLDGYSVTRLIRAKEKNMNIHTPIIAMTAYALSGDREKCIAAGMDDYISKPINFNELFKLIDKWLEYKGDTVSC